MAYMPRVYIIQLMRQLTTAFRRLLVDAGCDWARSVLPVRLWIRFGAGRVALDGWRCHVVTGYHITRAKGAVCRTKKGSPLTPRPPITPLANPEPNLDHPRGRTDSATAQTLAHRPPLRRPGTVAQAVAMRSLGPFPMRWCGSRWPSPQPHPFLPVF